MADISQIEVKNTVYTINADKLSGYTYQQIINEVENKISQALSQVTSSANIYNDYY